MPFFEFSHSRLRPAEWIISSFAALIALGTGLLMLPGAARGAPLPAAEALFTAASAVCVTGLVVVDTGTRFTLLGQSIILGLIQLGGLGIVTWSAFFFFLFQGRLSMRNREAVVRTLIGRPGLGPGAFLGRILLLALVVEGVGALCLSLAFARTCAPARALYLGLFHAISAFCNAGFALFPDSLVRYRDDLLVNATLMVLIVVGGLGFSVLLELVHAARGGRRFSRLSLHARIVLLGSGALIAGGALLFFAVERGNALRGESWGVQILISCFQSVSCRTAGFNTVDLSRLADTTLFAMILLMFVGGASGSCAGGIKVNTFGVLAAIFWNRLHGRRDINIAGRRLSETTLVRALSLSLLAFVLLIGTLVLLLVTELGAGSHAATRGRFLELAFESVSAAATVGLSTGVTPKLSSTGRLLIVLLMFAGRVGPLTLATLLHARKPRLLRYPEEDLIIG